MCHTSHDIIFILYVRRYFPGTHLALNEIIKVCFPVSKSMPGYSHQCSLIFVHALKAKYVHTKWLILCGSWMCSLLTA